MSSVSAVTAAAATGTTQKAGVAGSASLDDPSLRLKPAQRVYKQELDRDAFLQLMVAQMKYQDPSSPMDTTAMMQQTSNMAQVEQLTELTKTMRQFFTMQIQPASASMIGQTVTWLDPEGAQFSGKVTSVTFADGSAELHVGDKSIAWDRITQLTAPGATPPPDKPAPPKDDKTATDGTTTTKTA